MVTDIDVLRELNETRERTVDFWWRVYNTFDHVTAETPMGYCLSPSGRGPPGFIGCGDVMTRETPRAMIEAAVYVICSCLEDIQLMRSGKFCSCPRKETT